LPRKKASAFIFFGFDSDPEPMPLKSAFSSQTVSSLCEKSFSVSTFEDAGLVSKTKTSCVGA